jgi:hypothetical protein
MMKKSSYIIAISAFALGLNSCTNPCRQETCPVTVANNAQSITQPDINNVSPYYQQNVVTFNVSQATNSYSVPNSCSNCPASNSSVTLNIVNLTTKTITFGYSIQYNGISTGWDYNNNAVIGPSATLNVGQVSTNTANITGGIIVSTGTFSYQ